MSSDDFNGRSQAFLSWFKSRPGTTFHPDIELADLRERGAGRGIVATADIEPDTVLFTIPRSLIICPDTSDLHAKLPGLFAEAEAGAESDPEAPSQDRWSLLILVMMYEYLRGPRSDWKPYLDVLPAAFDTPMFWSEEELRGLQPTAVASRIGRQDADEMIATRIVPAIRAHADVFFPAGVGGDDSQLAELAHRMGSTIMAYAFDLEGDDDEEDEEDRNSEDGEDGWVEDREEAGKVLGMVPMADILNADADFNAHVNHGEDALVVRSLRHISAGEEVLNYYGPLSNGELLLRYGYVTPRSRRWDVVDLSWSSVAAGLMEQLGISEKAFADAEKKLDPLETEDVFYIDWDSEPPDSAGHVRDDAVEFQGLPVELQRQTRSVLRAAREVDPQAAARLRSSDAREAVSLKAARHALDWRLASYEEFAEQDATVGQTAAAAAAAVGGHPGGRRGEMARTVRLGETELLRAAQAWVQSHLAEVEHKIRSAAATAPPGSKRRRVA